mgnify:CR=1 FL=1
MTYCGDFVRHVAMDETHHSLVTLSQEQSFPDSVLVVETSDSVLDWQAGASEQTVYRYWYDPISPAGSDFDHQIRYEKVFSLVDEELITKLVLFDGLAFYMTTESRPTCPDVSEASKYLSVLCRRGSTSGRWAAPP